MYGFQIKVIVMKAVMKLGRRLEEYYGIIVKKKFRVDNSHINLEKYRPPHEVKGIIKNIINKFKP